MSAACAVSGLSTGCQRRRAWVAAAGSVWPHLAGLPISSLASVFRDALQTIAPDCAWLYRCDEAHAARMRALGAARRPCAGARVGCFFPLPGFLRAWRPICHSGTRRASSLFSSQCALQSETTSTLDADLVPR